ncbi:MAG: tRNA (adenosine(37)-N6)-dimethylallyltransferase MiaA, partial [Clostridia bacterium]|nr:tRNA (adenosine(37)-N6)-dimethylallyltransferase MiaA [Clostridia bacterium]
MGGATIRLLVILGPTAVGKTDLALDLAPRLGGEIVSADSTQVYRGMDIGTDKPPPEARRRVPHHLVDLRDPDEGFDVATYQRLAGEAVANIAARGRLPMLVGGSGLYIRAVVEGYQFLPAGADPAVREELARRAAERGAEDLLSELAAVDPAAARA